MSHRLRLPNDQHPELRRTPAPDCGIGSITGSNAITANPGICRTGFPGSDVYGQRYSLKVYLMISTITSKVEARKVVTKAKQEHEQG